MVHFFCDVTTWRFDGPGAGRIGPGAWFLRHNQDTMYIYMMSDSVFKTMKSGEMLFFAAYTSVK